MFVHAVELAVVDAQKLRVRDLVLARDPPTLPCKIRRMKRSNDLTRVLTRVLGHFSLFVVVRWTAERSVSSSISGYPPESSRSQTDRVAKMWTAGGRGLWGHFEVLKGGSKEAVSASIGRRPSPLPPSPEMKHFALKDDGCKL